MKKIIAVTIAMLLMLTLAGCSKEEPSTEDGSTVDAYEMDNEEPESSDSDDDSALLSPEFKKTMDDY